jgi:protein SCO1/2
MTTRREWLGFASACALIPRSVRAHNAFGPVQPALPAPALSLQDMTGKAVPLTSLLTGQVTAVQLMFTGCSATCPIQGAVFADAQARLAKESAGLRLLSLSIDPLGDDLPAMRAWLAKFGAQSPRWAAALPKVKDVDPLLDFLRGRAPGVDRHTAQAFVFDRHARLVYRTEDMPQPEELVKLMQRVAQRG